jgi:hypothetical protein
VSIPTCWNAELMMPSFIGSACCAANLAGSARGKQNRSNAVE